MVAAFPAAKLGFVFMKQLSKPIANFCKDRAKSSPVFRKYICIPPAQFYHWCEVNLKMWMLNLGRPVNIPVLNETMAIELGANLLGEGILLFTACAIVIAEYNRSANKEELKEKEKMIEKQKLNRSLDDLFFKTEQQATEITELKRTVYRLEAQIFELTKTKNASSPRPPSPPTSVPRTPSIKFRRPTETDKFSYSEKSAMIKAIYDIEEQFLYAGGEEWNPSIVTLALNHILKNVYRLPISS